MMDALVSERITLNLFQNFDVPALLRSRAHVRGNHPFLIWEPFEGPSATWSYKRFEHDTRALAAGLSARGIGIGDRVLIHMDNCPEITLAWYACAQLGAVAVTTNARSVGEEMTYFSKHCEAKAAITQPEFADLIGAYCPDIKWMAVTETNSTGAPGAKPDGAIPFDALFGDAADCPARPADPDLPVGVQYTSGTTSRPKGVVWTHANALWGGKMCSLQENLLPSDIHLCYLPLFHTNAQAYSVLAALWVGATVVTQPRFSASRFWPISLKHKCTWTSMVPFCVRALGAHDVPPEHQYRLWGNGISDAPWDEHFRVKTIGWWGMTETIAMGIVGDPFGPNHPLSIGRPSPAYDIAIVNDSGAAVGAGESGALKIRGVPGISLFAEYLNNPEATAKSFDEDGFFDTGDRVTLLDDGFVQFADRDKDMLKVGGENVAASEVERVIMAVPGVQEAAVVGKKDDMLDQVPVVFVLPAGGLDGAAPGLTDAILEACGKALADFKRPREVHLVDSLPRSTLEKIAKNQLRDALERDAS
jgi:crotonobetaine/carnitine-CoA ligase